MQYISISKISDTVLDIAYWLLISENINCHEWPSVARATLTCPQNTHASDLDPAVAVVSHCPSTFLLNNDALDPVILVSMLYAPKSFLRFLQAPMCSTRH